MRIVRAIFCWIGIVLGVVLSLGLGFVEGRTLFAGDWKLAENPGLAATGYAMRLLYFLLLLAFCVVAIINEVSSFKLYPLMVLIPLALVIGAVASFFFYQWYITAALLFATGLLSLEAATKKK